MGYAALAQDNKTAGYKLVVCEPERHCVQRGKLLTNATACALDAASLENVVPKGTRIGCIKVQQ